MNPIEWNSLSKEEKASLVELCKEDPVVFIETVCGVDLLECQKVIVRETFKRLRKPDKSELREKCAHEPNRLYGTESTDIFFDEGSLDLKPSDPKADFEKIYTDALKALYGYNPNDDEGKEK